MEGRSDAERIARVIAEQVGREWFFTRELEENDMFYHGMMNALRHEGLAHRKIAPGGPRMWRLASRVVDYCDSNRIR